MSSETSFDQIDLDVAMAKRNGTFGVHHSQKAEARKDFLPHSLHASIYRPETAACHALIRFLQMRILGGMEKSEMRTFFIASIWK